MSLQVCWIRSEVREDEYFGFLCLTFGTGCFRVPFSSSDSSLYHSLGVAVGLKNVLQTSVFRVQRVFIADSISPLFEVANDSSHDSGW